MKLLLVENDPLLADALIAQLGHAGFEIEHADNGAAAQDIVESGPDDRAYNMVSNLPGQFLLGNKRRHADGAPGG